MTLYNELINNMNSGIYPFHMPGHKRNIEIMNMINPYAIDITEIDGYDNLHAPEGVILNLMERIRHYYNTDSSFILINGSTSGILSAISAVTNLRDEVIVARNCHKAVYNAVYLRSLKAHYIMPKIDRYGICQGITPEQVASVMGNNKSSKVVIITSPTYEGVVSDIKAIADIVHSNNGILIVDEAHGAHFGQDEYFPVSSYTNGADIVIQSIHKTLPAMTQTAVMHVNHTRVSVERVKKFLSIYQTSSPSYVLMSSVDKCFLMLEEKGRELYKNYISMLAKTRSSLSVLKHMKVYEPQEADIYDYDKGKIIITIEDDMISGRNLYDILLKEYKLQMEMCQNRYVIAMTSLCDTKEGLKRLVLALQEIDNNWDTIWKNKGFLDNNLQITKSGNVINSESFVMPKAVFASWEIDGLDCEYINIDKAVNRIAADYVYVYPPGVPIIVPGENISGDVAGKIIDCVSSGLNVIGLSEDNKIPVLEETYIQKVKDK